MPNQKTLELRTLKTTTEPPSYVFEYDTRYYAVKSGPPTLAKLSLRGNQLHHEPVEIPRVGTGTKIVRLKGWYTGFDGDLFLRIEGGYADISVVHHGLQFAIWWGDSEDVAAQNSWLIGFLRQDPLCQLHVIRRLENHLGFIQERGIRRPGEEPALTDLIASLRNGTGAAGGLGDILDDSSGVRLQ
jgi:hypothetical protein